MQAMPSSIGGDSTNDQQPSSQATLNHGVQTGFRKTEHLWAGLTGMGLLLQPLLAGT